MKIHETALVEDQVQIGPGTRIWHYVHVRTGAHIGADCNIGRGVYIDAHVHIGDKVKIQNYVSVYEGVTVEEGVFIGPHAVFTNDKIPRAVDPAATDWVLVPTLIKAGAAIGANSVIVCGITVGRWAMIGSGAVVTKDVPDYGLVVGNPARLIDYVDPNGQRLHVDLSRLPQEVTLSTGETITLG
jgi:UDP-2-acetamido-3-amino-2,3-dideoxy-glucuronate N-acetyltransferase